MPKRSATKGTSFDKYLAEQMKDPKFAKAYLRALKDVKKSVKKYLKENKLL